MDVEDVDVEDVGGVRRSFEAGTHCHYMTSTL